MKFKTVCRCFDLFFKIRCTWIIRKLKWALYFVLLLLRLLRWLFLYFIFFIKLRLGAVKLLALALQVFEYHSLGFIRLQTVHIPKLGSDFRLPSHSFAASWIFECFKVICTHSLVISALCRRSGRKDGSPHSSWAYKDMFWIFHHSHENTIHHWIRRLIQLSPNWWMWLEKFNHLTTLLVEPSTYFSSFLGFASKIARNHLKWVKSFSL
jgi:hypothetical protein